MKDLKFYYPNNKPTLTTECELAKYGKAIECRGEPDAYNLIEVFTIDIFGRHEIYFIK